MQGNYACAAAMHARQQVVFDVRFEQQQQMLAVSSQQSSLVRALIAADGRASHYQQYGLQLPGCSGVLG